MANPFHAPHLKAFFSLLLIAAVAAFLFSAVNEYLLRPAETAVGVAPIA